MQNMNKQMKLPEIQKIMMEFEKQSEIMDMKEEMMTDVIGMPNVAVSMTTELLTVQQHFLSFSDDALEGEEDEEESDAIVTQVLDEVQVWLTTFKAIILSSCSFYSLVYNLLMTLHLPPSLPDPFPLPKEARTRRPLLRVEQRQAVEPQMPTPTFKQG